MSEARRPFFTLYPPRPWRLDRAQLFARVAAAHFDVPAPTVLERTGDFSAAGVGWIHVNVFAFTDHKWSQVIAYFGCSDATCDGCTTGEAVALWHRFWVELIPVDDVQLAAEHLAMLEEVAFVGEPRPRWKD